MPQEQPALKQSQTATSKEPLAPFYDRHNAPAHGSPGVRWLLERGWKCIAESDMENAEWFVPGAEDEDRWQEVAVERPVMTPDHTQLDSDGNPKSRSVVKQLMMQDGTEHGALTVPIKQTIVTPHAVGMSFREAIRLERERERQRAATKRAPAIA